MKSDTQESKIDRSNKKYAEFSDQNSLLIAVDPHSHEMLTMARKAAITNATILITGETGVGKEMLARYIHQHSAFQSGPFVSVNCAALPENMMESILFGYEKGAFTSAINQYIGKFEQAQNGTLLLDEISEIPITLQAKLLRVLQEREVERLGGKKLIKINARILAATNRDLKHQVATGLFRQDLYYRLNVVPIHCLPLRERKSDIQPLIQYFIEKHAAQLNRQVPDLSQAAKEKLSSYNWPGNVREMDNLIQRLLIMTSHNIIGEQDIIFQELTIDSEIEPELEQFESKIKINEAKLILETLRENDGARGITAKKLNMSPRTLRYKISKLKQIGIKI